MQLQWSASPGAEQYRVLRNTLGCGFGFTPVGTVDGAQRYFEDSAVAPGIPYYYSVQPVGPSSSCYGQASNCVVVTPSACGASPLAAPTGLNLSTPADNQVAVSWNAVAGAQSYKVFRKSGNCSAQDAFVPIGVVTAPATSFLDTIGLQGQFTYAYQVVASNAPCPRARRRHPSCASIAATGTCDIAPSFAA